MTARTLRPNSLNFVLLDSCLLAVVMAIVVAAMGAIGYSAETDRDAADEATAEAMDRAAEKEAVERALTDDHIDSRLNTDDAKPSGSPAESAAGEAESMILGMTLEAGDDGAIRVTDVGATTPAWDAGIRRGDRLVSLHGLKPTVFPRWVKDVGKLLAETQDGQAVPIEIARGGERLDLRIRLPESRVTEVRQLQRQREQTDLAQQLAGTQDQQIAGGDPAAGQQPVGPYGPGYGGVGVAGFADDEGLTRNRGDDRLANRAVAQLSRVDTLAGGMTSGGTANVNRSDPRTLAGQSGATGGRVGIATFENNNQGVAAQVQIGGLPQGSYTVGISPGGPMAGAGNSFGSAPPQQQRREQEMTPGQRPVGEPSPGGIFPRNTEPGIEPRNPGSTGTPVNPTNPSGASPRGRTSLAEPRGSAVLGQLLDAEASPGSSGDSAGSANPAQNPGDAPGVAPGTAPNSNMRARDASDAAADQQRLPPNARQRGETAPADTPASTGTGMAGDAGQFLAVIGVMQVGPGGTAQVQRQLEGFSVRDLVGLSVAVVSTQSQGGSGFGPGQVIPGTGNRAGQRTSPGPQSAAAGTQAQTAAGGQAANESALSGLQPDATGGARPSTVGQGGAPGGVVAIGVIQLADTERGGSDELSREERSRQEEAAIGERMRRRQHSPTPPTEQFDPSQP